MHLKMVKMFYVLQVYKFMFYYKKVIEDRSWKGGT